MTKTNNTRPPLTSLACVNRDCDKYGCKAADNLIVRKVYGKDEIRYLRCRLCRTEFSERRNSALFNSKVGEPCAIAIAEQLAEGTSTEGTARLQRVDITTVERMQRMVGQHGKQYHDQEAVNLSVETLQADERYGFAGKRSNPAWEAEMIDPASKFVLSHVQGRRDESLIRRLYADTVGRLVNRQTVALFTDGFASYSTLFPEYFGYAWYPTRNGSTGRKPMVRYRIPRSAAHVQIVKHQRGRRLESIEIRYVHGSQKRIRKALKSLNYTVANTSAIERRNGTARLMTATQTRKSLAFAKRKDSKQNIGWWALTVYNWCRKHRSLRQKLAAPMGKKSMNSERLQWQLA